MKGDQAFYLARASTLRDPVSTTLTFCKRVEVHEEWREAAHSRQHRTPAIDIGEAANPDLVASSLVNTGSLDSENSGKINCHLYNVV
jgi:hypothetical protein